MEGTEKAHMDKYKEIRNEWNYDASCTLTSLPVWDCAPSNRCWKKNTENISLKVEE
jgi:hypothetical protein